MIPSNEIKQKVVDPKNYLDYIDKEITFCGIITTFSLACVLFMVDKLLSKPDAATIINFKSSYFVIALITLIVSAYLLFLQRSHLAHRHGQISLETTQTGFTGTSIEHWLEDVDSWQFWFPYMYGIALIKAAVVEILILLLVALFKETPLIQFLNQYSYIISFAVVLIFIAIEYFNCKILITKSAKKNSETTLPHYKVYSRISVSKISGAGVGIIAIADIAKDEYIFYPDDDEMVWVDEKKIKDLPDEIKKLYNDFCIKNKNQYGCPVNFNKLSPAWYLNNSTTPNVYCDSDFRFRALRNITKGEELTSNYSTYSEV